MSADNQQERPDVKWIVGFVDGEGCFHVALNRQAKMTARYQVLPEFRVVQQERDIGVLEEIRSTFGFGKVTRNHGERYERRVRGIESLQKLIEFFEANPLRTKKKEDFEIFRKIIGMMVEKKHLEKEGLEEIADLASKMNRRVRRHLESSETICRNKETCKI